MRYLLSILLIAVISMGGALAQSSMQRKAPVSKSARYYGSSGRRTGSAVKSRDGRTTHYYDASGRSAGSSVTDRNGNTIHYDASGHRTGETRNN